MTAMYGMCHVPLRVPGGEFGTRGWSDQAYQQVTTNPDLVSHPTGDTRELGGKLGQRHLEEMESCCKGLDGDMVQL